MSLQVRLIEAVIEAFLLLETSGDDDISPGTAVRGMENIASCLLEMDPDEQILVRTAMRQLGESSDDLPYRNFCEGLPDMIGLAGG